MKLLLALLLLTLSAQAQTLRSLALTGEATYTVSSFPVGTARYEHRVSGLTLPFASNTPLFRFLSTGGAQDTLRCFGMSGTSIVRCLHQNDGSPNWYTEIDLAGKTDLRLRYQHYLTSTTSALEVWSGDCTGYGLVTDSTINQGTPAVSGTAGIGGSGQIVGFFRAYSTTVPTSSLTCPLDSPSTAADRVDFRFEGNTLDSFAGSPAYTLSAPGSSFPISLSYPPLAVISGWTGWRPNVRVTKPITLSAANSTTFSGSQVPASIRWTQVRGPSLGTWSSRTASLVTFTPPTAGGYTVRLAVTDADGLIATKDLEIGAVPTDDAGYVVEPNSDLAILAGPMLMLGSPTNPHPWVDSAAINAGDVLLPFATPDMSLSNVQAGTLTISASAPNSIQEGYICCSPLATVTGFNPATGLADGAGIWIWVTDGGYQGRVYATVDTRTSNSFRLQGYYWPFPEGQTTNVPFSLNEPAGPYGRMTQSAEPGASIGYYGAHLGLGVTGRRTRLASFDAAVIDSLQVWRKWAYQLGFTPGPRRNHATKSMMLLAILSGDVQVWKEVDRNLRRSPAIFNPTATVPLDGWDGRENAFTFADISVAARLVPNKLADPSGTLASYCTAIENHVNFQWIPRSRAIGSTYLYWPENLFNVNTTYAAAAIPPGTGAYGTSPWRISGLVTQALIYAYFALAPDTCNNSTLRATVLDMAIKSANFIHDYGRLDNDPVAGTGKGGIHYNALYESAAGIASSRPVTAGAGTVYVANGSTTVNGVGTSFTSFHAPCDGSTYIGINSGYGTRDVYRVQSCTSDTQLTINTGFIRATVSSPGVPHVKAVRASQSCGALSLATYCESADSFPSKDLMGHVGVNFSLLYQITGDTTWRDRADWWLGATLGGSDLGTGFVGTGSGPGADGYPTGIDRLMSACGVQPCTDASRAEGLAFNLQGKLYGDGLGEGRAAASIASRMGTIAPPDVRTITVGYTLPAGATTAQLSYMDVDGTGSNVTGINGTFALPARWAYGLGMYRVVFGTVGNMECGGAVNRALSCSEWIKIPLRP